MDIAIVGAGNGGQAAAGHLAMMGHVVRLYDRFPEVIEPIADSKRIVLTGAVEGGGTLEAITSTLATAIAGAEIIIVTVPGFALEYIAREMGPHLQRGQVVVLHPGGTGGAFEVRRVWNEMGLGGGVSLGSTETLVYACRLRGPGEVDIKAVKRRIMIAALPEADEDLVYRAFQTLYPQVVRAESVFETSLANTNPIMHPPIMLMNARNIGDGQPVFDFYGAGISSSIATVIDAIDEERLAVANALRIPTKTHHEWVKLAYGLESEDTTTLCQNLAREIYRGLESPPTLRSRYLTEDVPLGLVPLTHFARVASVETPVIDGIIDLSSVLCGEDFRRSGRTLQRMGLGENEVLGRITPSAVATTADGAGLTQATASS